MGSPADRITRIEGRPLQRPGRDRVVRESVLGGPEAAVDARLILSRADLATLTAIAESSITGRVVLNRPGVRVRLFESPAGHRYEVWSLVASEAVPEQTAILSGEATRLRLG